MHSLSPGSNYIIHTITYILLFLGQIICSRNSCHSRKYLVISALVIGSREIIPEHFEHVTHAQPWAGAKAPASLSSKHRLSRSG